jgi:hypothetical protein
VVRARHDVLPTVQAVARGETPERPAREDVAYRIERRGSEVRTERIDLRDAALLEALSAGATFAEACRDSGAARSAAALLVRASALGLLTGVQL